MTPFTRSILDAVVPATARWLVAVMRQLEEQNLDAKARWDLLRRRLDQLGQKPPA